MYQRITPSSIAHHLRIAAERYEKDAAFLRDPSHPAQLANSHEHLASHFDRQAAEARGWAASFENCHQVTMNKDGELVLFC